jgi:chromosome segregation ATPase
MHDDKLDAERRRYEKAANKYAVNVRDAQKNAAALKKAKAQLAEANRQIQELKAELARLRARGKDGAAKLQGRKNGKA